MKMSKSQGLNLLVTGLTLLGMLLGSKAQEHEMNEMKEELRLELRKEKENNDAIKRIK